MEYKIKELLLPYIHPRNKGDLGLLNETVDFLIRFLKFQDLYDIGKHLESNYLRHVDYDLLKGLEKIKQQSEKL